MNHKLFRVEVEYQTHPQTTFLVSASDSSIAAEAIHAFNARPDVEPHVAINKVVVVEVGIYPYETLARAIVMRPVSPYPHLPALTLWEWYPPGYTINELMLGALVVPLRERLKSMTSEQRVRTLKILIAGFCLDCGHFCENEICHCHADA